MKIERLQSANCDGQSNIIRARNYTDNNGNPAGGYCSGVGLCVHFQDGPRGKKDDGSLMGPNGAFVEDLIVAAIQRLEFFQESKFKHPSNAEAIKHCRAAIQSLANRAKERSERGVLGAHEV